MIIAFVHVAIVGLIGVIIAVISLADAYRKDWDKQNGILLVFNMAFVIYLTIVILVSILVFYYWLAAL